MVMKNPLLATDIAKSRNYLFERNLGNLGQGRNKSGMNFDIQSWNRGELRSFERASNTNAIHYFEESHVTYIHWDKHLSQFM